MKKTGFQIELRTILIGTAGAALVAPKLHFFGVKVAPAFTLIGIYLVIFFF